MIRKIAIAAALVCSSCASIDQADEKLAENEELEWGEEWKAQRAAPRISPGVTPANVQRLKIGMSRTEVRNILGPHSSYTNMGNGTALYQWMKTTSSAYSARIVHVSLIFENGIYKEMHHYSVIDG